MTLIERHCQEVKTFPKGTERLFGISAAEAYDTHMLEKCTAEAGGAHRYFIGGTPWPVVIMYLDQYTVMKLDKVSKLHISLGHPGPAIVRAILASGDTLGLNDTQKSDLINFQCAICILAKLKKPAAPASSSTAVVDTLNPFNQVAIDLHGPISPAGTGGERYVFGMISVLNRFNLTAMIMSKDMALDAFQQQELKISKMGFSADKMSITARLEPRKGSGT